MSKAHPDHKMSRLRSAGRLLALLGLLAVMLATTTAQRADVFIGGQVYFVDADCYSRMTRVAQVLAQPLRSIRHHDFENFPAGVATHTTAPMDAAIALLAVTLRPFTPQFLDLAGAWISPLLGLLMLLGLWVWSTRARLPGRHAMLFLLAVSPIVVQAFRLGRPDHQSLLLLLLAAGLAAEADLWRGAGRRTPVVWGVAWGLALWTSLYEPLVLFALLLALRAAFLGRGSLTKPWRVGLGVAAGVFGAGVLFDGWRVSAPSPEVAAYFPRWAPQIGELASLPPWSAQFPAWLGWFGVAVPVLLLVAVWRTRDYRIVAPLVVVLALFALTCWQIRWGCYLALAVAMAIPLTVASWRRWDTRGDAKSAREAARPPGRAAGPAAVDSSAPGISSLSARGTFVMAFLFFVGLWPVAAAWDALLFPEGAARTRQLERRAELPQLREIAARIDGPFLAPWWLSPPLAYWSRQPGVTGSSHESLPGIVDAARFWLSADPSTANDVLARRRVRYVVVDDPDRVLPAAAELLGVPSPQDSLALTLFRSPGRSPAGFLLTAGTPFFRVYAVTPLPPP